MTFEESERNRRIFSLEFQRATSLEEISILTENYCRVLEATRCKLYPWELKQYK